MNSIIRFLQILVILSSFAAAANDAEILYSSTFTKRHLGALRSKTKELFDHAWNSYLDYGFPADEVRPLSCTPHTKDAKDPFNIVRNDVLGNYTLTVFDNLDSFLILGEPVVFEKLVYWIRDNYPDFNIDSNVQVFETNIRILGGLLSAHLFASDQRYGFALEHYDGFLLKLAHDLGNRLVLAFDTKTHIPYPRTNLAKGPLATPKKLQDRTCTSGAGSPVLEFTLLSRLTGDTKFERRSKKAFRTLWNSRTELGLLPMTIDPHEGKWLDSVTGVGASVDSFYEYALKTAILFDDDEFMQIWQQGSLALDIHLKGEWAYENVDTRTGQLVTNWIDSLSAFWPGLQVLAGDVAGASKFHSVFMKVWETFDAIPERWNIDLLTDEVAELVQTLPEEEKNRVLVTREMSLEWYPLRPEFIESTYHLYRATKDPIYLQIGQDFLKKLETKYKAPCGFAGMLDIRNNKLQDRMESFVLSETLKYLYLLFDEDNFVHQINKEQNMVFSTEAHPLWFDAQLLPENTGFDWFLNQGAVADEDHFSQNAAYAATMQSDSIFDVVAELVKNWWTKDASSDLKEQAIDETARKMVVKSYFEKNSHITSGKEDQLQIHKMVSNFYDSYIHNGDIFKVPDLNTLFDSVINEGHYDFTTELKSAIAEILGSITLDFYAKLQKELPASITSSIPQPMANIARLNLREEPFHGSDVCTVPSIYTTLRKDSFLTSPLLSTPKFYHIDSRFQHSLIKPTYITEKSYDRGANSVELSYDFYHLFTSHLKTLPISSRYPTTDIFEGFFDPRQNIRFNPVSHLILQSSNECSAPDHNNLPKEMDMYINRLSGSRLRFEKLKVGRVDYNNEVITEEYMRDYDYNDREMMFRILKINGYDVSKDQMIWLNANDTSVNATDILVRNNGRLMIDNATVVNFALWLGS